MTQVNITGTSTAELTGVNNLSLLRYLIDSPTFSPIFITVQAPLMRSTRSIAELYWFYSQYVVVVHVINNREFPNYGTLSLNAWN